MNPERPICPCGCRRANLGTADMVRTAQFPHLGPKFGAIWGPVDTLLGLPWPTFQPPNPIRCTPFPTSVISSLCGSDEKYTTECYKDMFIRHPKEGGLPRGDLRSWEEVASPSITDLQISLLL
jgi:hypothetical protein